MGTHTHTNISSISLLQSNLKTNQQSKQIRSSTTIMSASTVNVKNISSATSEKEIKGFFSFCGKISSIEVTKSGESQNATVTFEKETAAKTALLLDNTQLGATQVQVSSATGSNDDDGSHFTQNTERDSDEITQEEKPRARIAAEYIAHGYVLGDQAKSVDQSYGVTQKANNLLTGLTSYFEKAAGTPTGQKLVNFYTQSSKQVQDIHAEARRLADLKKQDSGVTKVPGTEKTTCKCASDSTNCPCEAGKCACSGCSKSDVEKVSNTEKTTCKCGGDTKVCGCAPGKCSCSDCPKAETEPVAGTDKTTCKCGGDDKNCPCEAGKCACSGCSK